MSPGDTLTINDHTVRFIAHPAYDLAHPNEDHKAEEHCEHCAIVITPSGDIALLWLVGGMHWAVSRNDPHYERNREILR